MNFKHIIINHIKEHFASFLKKRIKNLVEITDKASDNIFKFILTDKGFYIEGHTFIETKESYNNRGLTGVDEVPIDFRFKITVENNTIVKSEIRFNITKMGTLTYDNGVVNAILEPEFNRKSLI